MVKQVELKCHNCKKPIVIDFKPLFEHQERSRRRMSQGGKSKMANSEEQNETTQPHSQIEENVLRNFQMSKLWLQVSSQDQSVKTLVSSPQQDNEDQGTQQDNEDQATQKDNEDQETQKSLKCYQIRIIRYQEEGINNELEQVLKEIEIKDQSNSVNYLDINIYMSLQTKRIDQLTKPNKSLGRIPQVGLKIEESSKLDSDPQESEIMNFLQYDPMSQPEYNQRQDADSTGRNQLITQNLSLKKTLMELYTQYEEMQQQDAIKTIKTIKKEPDNEKLAIEKMELRRQCLEIQKLEKHIIGVQKQLETSDIYQIMAKEDQLSLLRSEHDSLQKEKEALLKQPNHQHTKATELLRNEEIYMIKLNDLSQKLVDAKVRNHELTTNVLQCESELSKLNKNITLKEELIREMEEQIKERKQYPERWFYVTEEELAVLEDRLQNLKDQKQQMDEVYDENMRLLEQERKEKQKEADVKLMGAKELEKELKMNEAKYKELAKLLRQNSNLPMDKNKYSNKYIKLNKI